VRSLVKIYGENWKEHYDISWREENFRSPDSRSKSKFMGTNKGVVYPTRKRVDRKIDNRGYHTFSCSKKSTSNLKYSSIKNGSKVCSASECMKNLSLNGNVNSYIELYNDGPKASKRDKRVVLGEHSFPLNTPWCEVQKSYSKSIVSSISNWVEPLLDVQDDLKNCDPNGFDLNCKMKRERSESNKENVDPCQQYSSNSLYGEEIGILSVDKFQN